MHCACSGKSPCLYGKRYSAWRLRPIRRSTGRHFQEVVAPSAWPGASEVSRELADSRLRKATSMDGVDDHRQINRTRQGRQRRLVTADPIAGCRGERNSLRRFGAFGVTLSNGLQLKDRLPVDIGKTDGQRNQFFTQV